MINLAVRNLKLFFRDKASVFFSLLAVFIIIGLYVLFMGDMYEKNMTDIKNARFLMDSWIMAGLLCVTSITTTMGAFGTMVDDKSKKISKDFHSSPIKNQVIAGGYIISTFIIGVIMSIITFILAEIYIVASGGEFLPLISIIKVLGIILLSVLSSSSLVFFAVTFFKSQNAFASASTIIGTLIGFLTGIYIPIGSLPDTIQLVIKLFPVSHAGALFRQVFMQKPLSEAFANAPAEAITKFNLEFGVVFKFGNYITDTLTSILILVLTTFVFYGLASFNISRKKK